MNRRMRSGFTFIELLIVFALLAFALGVLLPALQGARLQATRAQSQNQLKQLGLGCHAYHDANKILPSGEDATGFSAAAYLLPYLEQGQLYNQFQATKLNGNLPVTAPAYDTVRGTVVTLFLSPMDPLSKNKLKTGPTNYLYSAGTKYSLDNNNGVFYKNSKTRLTDITDGTSNTVMIGETLLGSGSNQAKTVQREHVALTAKLLPDLKAESGVQEFTGNKNIAGDRCHTWIEGRFLKGTFTGTRKINDTRPDVDCEGQGGLSALRGLEKGANVALCDGSVRFVSEKVSFQTWQAACTRSGGEALGADW